MEIKHLSFSYDKKKILDNLSLKFKEGAITTLMGANGCGKSTLLNLCSRNLPLSRGKILVDGKDINEYKNKEFAKKVGMVYQQNQIFGDITVRKLISFARTPYLRPLQKFSDEDIRCVDEAIRMTGLEGLEDREVAKMSGGQRQRVFIAMALAGRAKILLLDEPTTYLDIKYQMDILELVKKINKELGITIIMVLHDIMQAINYSDEVVGLSKGKLAFKGKAEEVLNDEVISKLYGTDLMIDTFKGTTVVLSKNNIKQD